MSTLNSYPEYNTEKSTGTNKDGLKIVVIGGGLSGLVAAYTLQKAATTATATAIEGNQLECKKCDIHVHVLEARDRVGGRMLSSKVPVPNSNSTSMIDLGATWIWPHDNPELKRLSDALGVKRTPEPDGSAFRFEGGSQAIALKLEQQLLANERVSIELNCSVHSVSRVCNRSSSSSTNEKIDVLFHKRNNSVSAEEGILQADAVFIAIPPRLAIEHISFQPGMDDGIANAMRMCRTWMAQQGKFVAVYSSTSTSSSLSSTSRRLYWERTMVNGPLEIIFDHCPPDSTTDDTICIWGFLSNEKRWRCLDETQLKQACLLQLSKMPMLSLGEQALHPKGMLLQDWANEMYTCSSLDAVEPHPWQHPVYRHGSLFARGLWGSSLWLIGSETSSAHSAGFMEGAVESALNRVQQYLDHLNIGRKQKG